MPEVTKIPYYKLYLQHMSHFYFQDRIDEALDKANVKNKRISQGNHDEWLDRFVEENPHLARTKHAKVTGYLFRDAFHLKKRGYRMHPIGEYAKLGKLYLYHGHHYGGIHHSRNHLLNLGCNIMYGHWHDLQHREVTHIDGPKGAWSMGCLNDMRYEASNQWLGRRRVNWGHCFGIVDFFSGGNFTVDVVRVTGGKSTGWGELIDGTKKAA